MLLQINDVRPQDVGQYRVIATNPAGKDTTACKLNVVPDRRGVDSQPFIEPERFLNLKPIPLVTKPEDELQEPKRPPKVIVPLVDCDMEEQMPVIFTTTIDAGVPMAAVSYSIELIYKSRWRRSICYGIKVTARVKLLYSMALHWSG